MGGFSDQQNNGFGPISKKRGKKPIIIAWCFLVAFIMAGFTYEKIWGEKESNKGWSFDLSVLAVSISGAVLGELIRRSCLFFEEYGHIQTRHKGNTLDVLCACFLPPHGSMLCIMFVVGISISTSLITVFKVEFNMQHIKMFLVSIIFVPLFSYVTGLRSSTGSEISEKIESESKNVADGLAWSYYFGYLKLILPHLEKNIAQTTKEVDGKDLCDHIQDKKVFIVIPKDCYCYSSFTDVDKRIKFVDNTHPHEVDRAGVQRRVYKNSVYKIEASSGKVYHCLMEYATPLMSLYDMAHHQNSGIDVSWKEEQVVLFFKKLKEILESEPECRGKYHIVLTSDARNNLADTMEREIQAARSATNVRA